MNHEVRVGLIGYGYAGKTFHAPTITAVPGLKLAKVVERRSEESKRRYPWVEVVKDVRDLYADESIDVVVITTPSTDHYEFVKDALLAGKHVVVEKPFTVTTEEADRLILLAKERGKMLSVYHNRRWDGDFMTVRELIRQGMLGRVVRAELNWSFFQPEVNTTRWRESDALGSGVFYDLGSHFIDQAQCLFGLPRTVTADIGIQRPGGLADDYFEVALGYDDGLKVVVKASKLSRERGPRYVLHGDKGSFVKYGLDPQEEALKRGETPQDAGWGEEVQSQWGTLNTTIGGLNFLGQIETIPGAFQDYYRNIYEHIAGGAELAVKPEEARNTMMLIELARKSSQEKRTIDVTL
jgi:scyllo-inositol 2-dehydrogenase (NADP+)